MTCLLLLKPFGSEQSLQLLHRLLPWVQLAVYLPGGITGYILLSTEAELRLRAIFRALHILHQPTIICLLTQRLLLVVTMGAPIGTEHASIDTMQPFRERQ